MPNLIRSTLPALLMAILLSPFAFAQSDRSVAIDAIKTESDAMRQELIQRYRSSPVFGKLLSKNSKIKGAARRLEERLKDGADLQTETKRLDQLLFDLESTIEEANFQASIEESKLVLLRLGGMIANLEKLKNGTGVAPGTPSVKDELLGTEFDPVATSPPRPGTLNSPLIMGADGAQEVQRLTNLEMAPESAQSVLEVPRITLDEPSPGGLVLPDLTVPTPENSMADNGQNRTVLKPPLLDQSGDEIALLPFDNRNPSQGRIPRMQSPQALSYGGSYIAPRTRFNNASVQVEFFSISRGFGYQPYGGYVPRGYWPYGGFGYGGGSYCPYGR